VRRGLVAVVAVVLAATAACGGSAGGGAGGAGGAGNGGGGTSKGGENGAPKVTITPGNGAQKARPDQGIVVTAAGGTLQSVTVKAAGAAVPGTMSADHLTWRSKWTLTPGASYEASASAAGTGGKTTTATSAFRTLKPAVPLTITDVTPNRGEVVGVGMPITVLFNRPVGNKAAVERALEIHSTKPAVGAWLWVNDREVIFRTKNGSYWHANQKVSFTAHLAGVKAGSGVYGSADVTHNFRIGDSHIITVNSKTDRLVVKKNGKVFKTWGVSLGTGGDVQSDGVDHLLTTSGVHLTMAKSRVERMISPGKKKGDPGYYDEKVPFATRISNSGEYIHQNMDDPTCLGNRNCSHGCVRSPAASAQWFYGWAYRGDVVIITGTNRQLGWDNGWGYYQKPWKQWVKGSALNASVTT
jgi:lipoprotein-anchoring transpeptidase ErfK/SrfK